MIIFIGDYSLKKKVMINLIIRKINNINYAKNLVFFCHFPMFIATFKGANSTNLVGDKLGYFYPWNIILATKPMIKEANIPSM